MSLKNLMQSILGTTKLPKATLDKIFSITTAQMTLEAEYDLKPAIRAAVSFKPIESSRFESARKEIEELLTYSSHDSGSSFRIEVDVLRYIWVILEDPDFEDLVTGIHMVSQTMIDRGYGAYLLCAVFRFESEHPVYWIYNFKKGLFYPFIPTGGKNRDNAGEIRLRTQMERELPIEKDIGMWYPLWGIPL